MMSIWFQGVWMSYGWYQRARQHHSMEASLITRNHWKLHKMDLLVTEIGESSYWPIFFNALLIKCGMSQENLEVDIEIPKRIWELSYLWSGNLYGLYILSAFVKGVHLVSELPGKKPIILILRASHLFVLEHVFMHDYIHGKYMNNFSVVFSKWLCV